MNLRYPPGTPIAVTNDGVGRLEAFLRRQPDVDTIQSVVGSSSGGVGSIFAGANSASLTVQMAPVGKRPSIFELIPVYRGRMLALLRDQPGAQVSVSARRRLRRVRLGFAAQPGLAGLRHAAGPQRPDCPGVAEYPYVVDVRSSLSDTSLENDFVPDPARLKGTGITPAVIAQAAADLRLRAPRPPPFSDRGLELPHTGAGRPVDPLRRAVPAEPAGLLTRARDQPAGRPAGFLPAHPGPGGRQPLQPPLHGQSHDQPGTERAPGAGHAEPAHRAAARRRD